MAQDDDTKDARAKTGRHRGQPPISFWRGLRYGVETALAYILYGFFWLLPTAWASALGGWLLAAIGPHMGISRVGHKNLDIAFPEKSRAEKEAILRGMWNNLGRVIAEYPHLGRLWPRVELVGAEHFRHVRDSGRPVIFWSGHLANWEIAGMSARQNGIDVHMVYRKPNNPGVDGLLRHAREKGGAGGHIRKGAEGARQIMSVLRRGGAVGMLVDQKLREGVPVPFFGRPASTASVVAQFAARFDCLVHPVRVERLPGVRFRITVYPAMEMAGSGDRKADAMRCMVETNRMLEEWIREKPEDWLWIHRRWPESAASGD